MLGIVRSFNVKQNYKRCTGITVAPADITCIFFDGVPNAKFTQSSEASPAPVHFYLNGLPVVYYASFADIFFFFFFFWKTL